MKEMVVSLRKGVHLEDVTGGKRLAEFLREILVAKTIEDLPTGTTAVVHIDDIELEKLKKQLGEKCYIVARTIGHVDI